MAFSLWYLLLFLAAQGTIPFLIGYFLELSKLKKGEDSDRNMKFRWVILPGMAIVVLSVAGMHLIPAVEELCATMYLFSFGVVLIAASLALGRSAAKSDFRRKQK